MTQYGNVMSRTVIRQRMQFPDSAVIYYAYPKNVILNERPSDTSRAIKGCPRTKEKEVWQNENE